MTKTTVQNLVILMMMPMMASVARANNAASQIQTSVMQAPGEESIRENGGKRLSILTGLEYSQAAAVEERGTRASSTDFSLALSYRTSDLTTMTVKAVASKDHAGPQDTTLSNTQVILGVKGRTLNDHLTTAHSLIAVAPTSEVSQKRDRLQTALGISNGLNFISPYLAASYRLGVNKNFHEYNINADGKANIEYTLTNSVGVDVPVYKSWHITADLLYRNGWTYAGFSRTSFGINADIVFDINSTLSLNLGTSNEGSALKANGVDSNIAAYDDKTSVFRAGLSYIY